MLVKAGLAELDGIRADANARVPAVQSLFSPLLAYLPHFCPNLLRHALDHRSYQKLAAFPAKASSSCWQAA